MPTLVTGADGYLGGWLLEVLKERGHGVLAFDSHERKLRGNGPVDSVVHLGWYAVAGSEHAHLQSLCVEMTRRLLFAQQAVPCFVFASTASVYGDRDAGLCSEETQVSPNCAYTRAKVKAEELVRARGMDRHCILRFGSFMGLGAPGCRTRTDLAVNAFATEAWTTGRINVWNPLSWKPVIHVRDAAELVVDAIEQRWVGTVNAAQCSMPAMCTAISVAELTGASVEKVEDRSGPRSCNLDCTKLAKLRGPHAVYRSVLESVKELQGRRPAETDRNVPW
jgi:nucleoside-diphosphate-sugar epimerase